MYHHTLTTISLFGALQLIVFEPWELVYWRTMCFMEDAGGRKERTCCDATVLRRKDFRTHSSVSCCSDSHGSFRSIIFTVINLCYQLCCLSISISLSLHPSCKRENQLTSVFFSSQEYNFSYMATIRIGTCIIRSPFFFFSFLFSSLLFSFSFSFFLIRNNSLVFLSPMLICIL